MFLVQSKRDRLARRSNGPRRAALGRHERRGAVTVEMALVAPVFFLFVLGVIEFTRAMMVQALLTNAAHQGARVGILDNSQASDVKNAVDNYLSAGGITGANTLVDPSTPSSATYGQFVTVTVSVPYSSVSWLPSPTYLKSITLTAKSAMRRETVQ